MLGNDTTQDTFEVFELLAAARGPTCAASLEASRGTERPPKRGGCGGVRWRGEARAHLLLPIPGWGAAAQVALEGLIEVAVQPERLEAPAFARLVTPALI